MSLLVYPERTKRCGGSGLVTRLIVDHVHVRDMCGAARADVRPAYSGHMYTN